jgi:hypothetical protein
MQKWMNKWDSLFAALYPSTGHKGCRITIDDILLFSSDIPTLLQYLECICDTFIKYHVSLKLPKCDFLKDHFEYVSHDLTANGNCPAQSKFNLIYNWGLPASGQSLQSFVSLCNFYHRYCARFEVRAKPLRAPMSDYHQQPIPASA